MRSFTRAEKVGGQIQKILADVLHKNVKDPRLEMATITSVKMSSDLKHARIYFITSGTDNTKTDTVKGFKSAMGYIKRTLAQHLGLRYMPDLKFYYDTSFDYGSQIDLLLKQIEADNETNPEKTTE